MQSHFYCRLHKTQSVPKCQFFKKECAGLTTCCECYLLLVTSAMTSLPLWHFEHKHVFLNHLKWKCLNVLENWVLSNLLDAESFNKVLLKHHTNNYFPSPRLLCYYFDILSCYFQVLFLFQEIIICCYFKILCCYFVVLSLFQNIVIISRHYLIISRYYLVILRYYLIISRYHLISLRYYGILLF